MGLPPNPLGIAGITFARIWGPLAPSARQIAGQPSIPSKSSGTCAASAGSGPPAPVTRWWAAVYRAGRTFVRDAQAVRLREARREVARIRARLQRRTSSAGKAAGFVRYG